MIGKQFGQFEVLAPIGEGGMGTVYRGRDLRFGREVAIKLLPQDLARDQEFVQRFMREARTAANLDHPNIIDIYDAGVQEGVHYIVMRLAKGETLHNLLRRTGPLPLERVSRIVEQLTSALDHAHQHGIIHRDIKPANVMVGDNDYVTLMDFGIAKAPSGQRLTRVGQVMGTIEYMSPEQFTGDNVDTRTDIYSLGVLIFEMLTGVTPFSSDTLMGNPRAYDSPPSPRRFNPKLSPAVERVLLRCLERAPGRRYQTAGALYAALRDAVAEAAPRSQGVAGPLKLVLDNGREYALEPGVTRLGRAPDNAIVLDDTQVSRYHAEVHSAPQGCALVDLGSTNGTFVNGRQLAPNTPHPLQPGDQVYVGSNVRMTVQHGPAARPAAPATVASPVETTAPGYFVQPEPTPAARKPRFRLWWVALVLVGCFAVALLGIGLLRGIQQSLGEPRPRPATATPTLAVEPAPRKDNGPDRDDDANAASGPTSTPAPTPEAGTRLALTNDSGMDVYHLYLSPEDADEWGKDWLEGDVVRDGATYVIPDVPPGTYDIKAEDEDEDIIEIRWNVEVQGRFSWAVTGNASLEVTNASGLVLDRLYFAPSGGAWGRDRLAQALGDGSSATVEDIARGSYDIKAARSDGTTIEVVYNVTFDGVPKTWRVQGMDPLPSGAVLRFEDDFRDNRNNWGRFSETSKVRYIPPSGGRFCIEIKTSEYMAWEWYEPFRTDDFVAEVLCTITGAEDASCGLGFGADADNFFWFELAVSEQEYALWLQVEGDWQDNLLDRSFTHRVNPNGENLLGLRRIGDEVTLYVNGMAVRQVESARFPEGRVGIGGSTDDEGGATICMDDLKVWRIE